MSAPFLNPKTLSGYLIDPDERTIKPIRVQDTLSAMHATLTRPGAPKNDDINAVRVGPQAFLWVDGEGFLKEDVPVWRIEGYHNPLAGRGLVLGINDEGESLNAPVMLDELQRRVRWLDHVSTGKVGATRELAPGHIRIGDPILKQRGVPK